MKFHTAASGKCATFAQPRFVAIGVFDGVHPGHQAIIKKTAESAARSGMIPLALSFSPHPRQQLFPGNPPPLLMPEKERINRLYLAGAVESAFIDFTAGTAALSPEEFLKNLAENHHFKISGICVGAHWKFGRAGSGNSTILKKFCEEHHWIFHGVPEIEIDGEIVSSTLIRNAAAAGNLEKFRRISGSELTLYGTVAHGFAIAGNTLNAPTANLECSAGVIPPDGVYAASAEKDGKIFPAAVNIGFAPTFNGTRRRVEVHLIGFSGNIYETELAVRIHKFIRPEQRFASPQALKKQICMDINFITETVKDILK